jgi:putative membrane protein
MPRRHEVSSSLKDPRALLAAERTLLAWLRTGLSLIAFGFLIARIGVWLRGQGVGNELRGSRWMGALFAGLGAIANLMAFLRYVSFRKAILSNGAVPTSPLAMLTFAASVALVGAALSAIVLAQLL